VFFVTRAAKSGAASVGVTTARILGTRLTRGCHLVPTQMTHDHPQAASYKQCWCFDLCSPEPNNYSETVIQHKLRTKEKLGKVGSNLVTCHDPCSLSRILRDLSGLSSVLVTSTFSKHLSLNLWPRLGRLLLLQWCHVLSARTGQSTQ